MNPPAVATLLANQTLQFIQSGDANQGGGYAAMAKQYETETGVKIEVVEIPNADLPTKLKNAAQADDLPALARAGGVDPVWKTSPLTSSRSPTAPACVKICAPWTRTARCSRCPSDVTAVGLFLNKSLFTEAGVDYPTSEAEIWSWDDCVAAIKQVQSKAGASYGMVMDRSSHRLKAFLYEFGSTGFQPGTDGQFQTNSATKTALEYFKDLNDDKFMPRSVWLSNADGNALFKSGDVVSYFSGSWQIADFAKNIKDFEWVSVYLPKQPVRATNFGNAASMVIFDGTGQEQAAQDFVNWLYKAENYTEAERDLGLPTGRGRPDDRLRLERRGLQDLPGGDRRHRADRQPDQADGVVVRGQGAGHRGRPSARRDGQVPQRRARRRYHDQGHRYPDDRVAQLIVRVLATAQWPPGRSCGSRSAPCPQLSSTTPLSLGE